MTEQVTVARENQGLHAEIKRLRARIKRWQAQSIAQYAEIKRLRAQGAHLADALYAGQQEIERLRATLKVADTEIERLRADAQNGNRPLPYQRDELGRMVREAWVRWAQTQPAPKPTWLVPYDKLPEPDKEADRQIGEAVARFLEPKP